MFIYTQKYTQYAHILYIVNKNVLFWMRLIMINHLTALWETKLVALEMGLVILVCQIIKWKK